MANLAGEQRLGRRQPRRLVRLLRHRHRHDPAADLPRLPERQCRRQQSRGVRRTPSTTWANSTIAGRLAAPNPNPNAAAVDFDGNLTRRTQAQRLGYPANFFVVNPDVANVNVTDSGAFSKYNALQIEMRRRLSKGLSANVNYQYAFEGGSQFDGFSFGRAWTDTPVTGNPTVRHAIKFQADWIAAVRPRRALRRQRQWAPERPGRRLERDRRRPLSARAAGLRQRQPGRHDGRRPAVDLQVLPEVQPRHRASTRSGCCRTT